MAESTNKIDLALAALRTKLATLVTAGTLRKAPGSDDAGIGEYPLLPAACHEPPCLAVFDSRLKRMNKEWHVDVMLHLVARANRNQVLKGVQDAIDAHAVSGSALAAIDSPQWDSWYDMAAGGPNENGFSKAGFIGTLLMRVEDAL